MANRPWTRDMLVSNIDYFLSRDGIRPGGNQPRYGYRHGPGVNWAWPRCRDIISPPGTIKPPGVLGRVKNAGLDVNDDAERLELSNEETDSRWLWTWQLGSTHTECWKWMVTLKVMVSLWRRWWIQGNSLRHAVGRSSSRWMACKLHNEPPSCDGEWTNIGAQDQAWYPSGPHLQLGDLVVG